MSSVVEDDGTNTTVNARKYCGMFEVLSPEKSRQVREKDWFQQTEVPKGTGRGV